MSTDGVYPKFRLQELRARIYSLSKFGYRLFVRFQDPDGTQKQIIKVMVGDTIEELQWECRGFYGIEPEIMQIKGSD